MILKYLVLFKNNKKDKIHKKKWGKMINELARKGNKRYGNYGIDYPQERYITHSN